jgi:Staphylococcal nuclease homologue
MLSAIFLATIIGISDGDTLTVLAPEQHQPFGTRSKQSLSDLCFGKQAEVIPQATDRFKRTVAKVKCEGVDANVEQVNRGMAWVYNRYVTDYSLSSSSTLPGQKREGCGLTLPPWRHGYTGETNAMPDLTALQQYTLLVDELVLHAGKEELAACARLLAMNVAHYEMRYGALPLEEQLMLEGEFRDRHAELVTMAMETMAGVLGTVIQGLDKKIEH